MYSTSRINVKDKSKGFLAIDHRLKLMTSLVVHCIIYRYHLFVCMQMQLLDLHGYR